MTPQPTIRVLTNAKAMVNEIAEKIVDFASRSAVSGEMFSLFLSGGSTPKALYELLASDAFRGQIDWRAVELYFGDERCVPPDSDLSNYKMAKASLIDRVPIPADNVYRMKGELEPEEAAKQAVENDVHVVGVSSLAAGHLTLVPQIIAELKKLGREDIIVIVGGVIPAQDYDQLYKDGAAAIFGPGTPIATAAIKMLEILLAD